MIICGASTTGDWMADWDLLLRDARIATMNGDAYGVVDGPACIATRNGEVAWLGPQSDCPDVHASVDRSVQGKWITPALIDCHTHLVFAGNRAAEFEQRLQGVSYEAIARAGGGILSTVRATRAAALDELVALAVPRATALGAEGVATLGNQVRLRADCFG